ncbi:aminotransferase class I/II-fold pyridoxal phosphate-dependent enzyme [Parahaliea maris]|uniref:Aminotransferase class I/II-fold pyridoxal phosphate-dependent enzyme n=2 Tax=Parahaliea maris TaxID=2716870 RepID=A0A5C8ZUS5_9GAMM|nr:methionine aminotransferase [Parahaliea maris]TXS92206.1 aminotransferase class I/II-fold pyridoxal phosphate-dependent enzyme [Parahaliea maris]
MAIHSKLPDIGTTIFTRMSALAREHGAINLSQGFPDFPAPEGLRRALAHHALEGHNQYAPMIGEPALREQVAAQLQRFRGVTPDPVEEITIVPGATEGIFCAIMALVDRDDEVILLDPSYDSYEPAVRLAGGRAIHVPLIEDTFAVDWDHVSGALSSRTRMIVINSPHNPTGAVLSHSDLETLEELAELRDLLVVSDEVYEHLVFDGARHHSVLEYPALRSRSVTVYSFGKTYGVTGWKTGYCVAPPALTAELRKVHQFNCFVGVTPVQLALADFMAEDPDYPGTLPGFYQAKRDLLHRALANSRFRLRPSAGTYFQLLDYSDITDEPDHSLCERWTVEQGVASIPISIFYQAPPQQHYLRLCFAKQDEQLLRAAETLCRI